jgi:hypothetical protein
MKNTTSLKKKAALFTLICLVPSLMGTFTLAQTKGDSNVVVKYKQYESFDLGNLEVKGQIIAPGDISVQQRRRKKFYRKLLLRKSFDRESIQDIKNLR